MQTDLAQLINVEENLYKIISAVYYKDNNLLEIMIESENPLKSNLEEDLREYFSYLDLKILYKRLEVHSYDDYIPEYEGEEIYEDVPDNLNDVVFKDEIKEENPNENLAEIENDHQEVEENSKNTYDLKENTHDSDSVEDEKSDKAKDEDKPLANDSSNFDDLKKAKEAQLQRKIAQALNYQNKKKEKEEAKKKTDGLNFGRKIKADPIQIEEIDRKSVV